MEKAVAISGLPGSGSTTIAKLLAKNLDYNYFSAGQLFKDVASGRYREQTYFPLFSEICSGSGLEIPDYNSENDSRGTTTLWEKDFGKSPQFHGCIDSLQIELAKRGRIVVDGKLSLCMIDCATKIWIEASAEQRAIRTSQRDRISIDEARAALAKREETERSEWGRMYGIDYSDQKNLANLIKDSSDFSPEKIVDEILGSSYFRK